MSSDSIKRPKRIIALTPPDHNSIRSTTPRGVTVLTMRRTERFRHTLSPSLPSTLPVNEKSLETKMHMLTEPSVQSYEYPLAPDFPKDKKDISTGLGNAYQPKLMALVESTTDMPVHLETSCIASKVDMQDLMSTEIPAWVGALADLIAETCASSDETFSHWSVIVPLDQNTLPETILRIDFSPSRLLLRFCTQSTHSLNLISLCSIRLIQLITDRLPDFRNIEVELT